MACLCLKVSSTALASYSLQTRAVPEAWPWGPHLTQECEHHILEAMPPTVSYAELQLSGSQLCPSLACCMLRRLARSHLTWSQLHSLL